MIGRINSGGGSNRFNELGIKVKGKFFSILHQTFHKNFLYKGWFLSEWAALNTIGESIYAYSDEKIYKVNLANELNNGTCTEYDKPFLNSNMSPHCDIKERGFYIINHSEGKCEIHKYSIKSRSVTRIATMVTNQIYKIEESQDGTIYVLHEESSYHKRAITMIKGGVLNKKLSTESAHHPHTIFVSQNDIYYMYDAKLYKNFISVQDLDTIHFDGFKFMSFGNEAYLFKHRCDTDVHYMQRLKDNKEYYSNFVFHSVPVDTCCTLYGHIYVAKGDEGYYICRATPVFFQEK